MQSPRQMPPQIMDALERGGVVICANARAARALGRLYGERMTAQGRRSWETPQIVDWTQWLQSQWMHLLLSGQEDRTLLTSLQEEVLWNEIVRPAVESRSLITASDVARLTASAYARLSSYDATHLLHKGEWDHPSLEQELFRKWAMEMERRCQRNHWLCETRLPWRIAEALRERHLKAPPLVVWNGFDRLAPVDETMRLVLHETGCSQTELTWDLTAIERLIAVPSIQDEFEACALWARDHLRLNPGARIGVLLPDVASCRAEVDRVFRSILTPETSGASTLRSVYEFTLGIPLADVPVIASALTLLQWFIDPQEQETITWLLTTAFFSPARDTAMLAEADIKVRRHLIVPELAMEELLDRFAGGSGGNAAAMYWVSRMRRAGGRLRKMQGKIRSCSEWVSTISAMLTDAGWPGERETRSSDSFSFQVRDRWQRALEEVSALSFADRRYDFRDFLTLLSSHLRTTVFSPESLDAPITISGIPESAGRSFDAVWVCEATDTAMPPAARMHPLLPVWLQMDTGMPGSSWDLNMELTTSALDRLRSSTSELIFSYAREGADGAQRPSSLVAHLIAEEATVSVASPSNLLESFIDEMTVPWPGGPAPGGQGALKDQSACPFKAFASRRLSAHAVPSVEPGLNALERGTMVHSVLEKFWIDDEMTSQAKLQSVIFSGHLSAVVQQCVSLTMEKYEVAASSPWERSYLQLEQERVCTLIEQWLRREAQRRPFEVEKGEKNEAVLLDGLELNVRMDRIDKTETGRVLLDYKTGAVSAEAWDGERPREPQLPLYAISGNVEDLRDVLFAQVRKDEIRFVSAIYGSKPDIFPENSTDGEAEARFREKCEEWTRSLHALSRQFQQGLASVTPREYPSTCKHCDFPGLCRVAEHAPGIFASDEDEL